LELENSAAAARALCGRKQAYVTTESRYARSAIARTSAFIESISLVPASGSNSELSTTVVMVEGGTNMLETVTIDGREPTCRGWGNDRIAKCGDGIGNIIGFSALL
jgi:hypothetical protein